MKNNAANAVLHIFLSCLMMLCVSCGISAQNSPKGDELSKRIGEIAEAHAANDNFSGAVLLSKNGQAVYEKTFGFADRAKSAPFTVQTASSIASVGKIFTSVLVLQLAEEKKLSLSDSVSKFLPDTKIPNAGKITIHQLLTHTSGLGNYMAHTDYAKLRENRLEIDAVVSLIERQSLAFETPGAKVEYSNSGYIVLGKIIESVTGKKYAEVLEKRILNPLAMKSTGLELNRNNFGGLAKGYFKPNPVGEWQSTEKEMPTPASDGGLFTTAKDLFAFDRALFGGKLLKRESFELMKNRHTEMTVPGLGKMNYGYGLMISDYPNNAYSIGHNGGSPGYGTEFVHYFIGQDEFTLIIISNYDRRTRQLKSKIQDEITKLN